MDGTMLDNPIPWPGGARCAVAITWDVDCYSGLNYYNRNRRSPRTEGSLFLRFPRRPIQDLG
jgi:hypothetical protein